MPSPANPPVEIHFARMFWCPECELPNHVREFRVQPEPGAKIPGTDIPDGGYFDLPDRWWHCEHCGHRLNRYQRRPIRPFGNVRGGCVQPAWWFTCNECGKDVYCDITIYDGNRSEGPPSMVYCPTCEKFFAGEVGGFDSDGGPVMYQRPS